MIRLIVLITFGLIALVSCDQSSATPDQPRVLLLAASSTNDAVTEIAALFEQQTGIRVTISTGGSNMLANQIVSGVDADLFLSANPRWADAVIDAELASQTKTLLGNQLVLVVPNGNPGNVIAPDDLLNESVEYIALAGEYVPAGIYARQALEHHDLYAQLTADSLIARGENVRMTLSFVERAEAQAGIVYATDVRSAPGVEIAYTFAIDAHDQIEYPLVLLNHAQDNEHAQRLYEFMSSADATAIFTSHGFAPTAVNSDDAGP